MSAQRKPVDLDVVNPKKPSKSEKSKAPAKSGPKEPTSFLDDNWSWSNFSSWPLSAKFLPAFVALAAVFIGVYVRDFLKPTCASAFDFGFDVKRVQAHAIELAEWDWEIGTVNEALLEFADPELSVFSTNPFPRGKIPTRMVFMDKGCIYIHRAVRLNEESTLWLNTTTISGPASLGVGHMMMGAYKPGWLKSANRQKQYLLETAPRFENGAISHTIDDATLSCSAIFGIAPFLAYYGVPKKDIEVMREAFKQVELHADILVIQDGPKKGLWKHTATQLGAADDGAWSTGNGLAAYGMLRTRATILAVEKSRKAMQSEVKALEDFILDILQGAIRMDDEESGLLRNYLGDSKAFRETSGTALLAAAAYRMGTIMEPGLSRQTILTWADKKRKAVINGIDADGIVKPAVDARADSPSDLAMGPSPEGEAYLLLLAAAWRDCVCSGICSHDF